MTTAPRHSPGLATGVAIGVTILIGASTAHAHWTKKLGDRSAATAYAVPLKNITIDGKLDDWPKNMVRYPVLNNWSPYGASDLQGQSLQNNPDLTAHFMVGYDPQRQVLYVAAIVRDDVHVPVNNSEKHASWETDAFEIYIDGMHTERHEPWYEIPGIAGEVAMQYAGWVGPEGPDAPTAPWGKTCNPHGSIPFVRHVRASQTGARFKGSRHGEHTYYEFALRVHNRFPGTAEIEPGKRIGFDVVVSDMDVHDGKMTDRGAWVPFGQRGACKYKDASTLADLVFLKDRNVLGSVAGQLRFEDEDLRRGDIIVETWNGALPAAEAHADAAGRFMLHAPAGTYTLRPLPGQGIAQFQTTIQVKAGQTLKQVIEIKRSTDDGGGGPTHEHHH